MFGDFYGDLFGEIPDSSFCVTSADCAEGLDRSLGETPDHLCQPLTGGDLENLRTVFDSTAVQMRLSPQEVKKMYGFDSTTVGLCMPIINGLTNQNQQLRRTNKAEELVGVTFGELPHYMFGDFYGDLFGEIPDSSFCVTSADCAEGLDRSLGETPDHLCQPLTGGDLENLRTVFDSTAVQMRLSPQEVKKMYGFDSTTVGLCMPIIGM